MMTILLLIFRLILVVLIVILMLTVILDGLVAFIVIELTLTQSRS